MWKIVRFLIISGILLASSAACQNAPSQPPAADEVRELSVMTHDSFEVSEDVIAIFENEHNVRVKFLKAGDTGAAVNKAVLSVDNPLADVFYGVDNTFLSRALDGGIFEPYASPQLDQIPDQFLLDDEQRALPVDYGDVCLNIDLTYFENAEVDAPADLDDLLEPAYAGLLVVENPATSSPGLAFLMATIGRYGDPGYLTYWEGLVQNDLLVVNDWETAYYSDFSRWGGTRPIVVSYGSSPPFEVLFAEEEMLEPPTQALTSAQSCFRQIEFVGILKGTTNRGLAEAWVDFMLSPTFQEDMPLNMYVFPVLPQAELDETFETFMAVPAEPVILDPARIAENREKWIEAWTEAVLR